jgi:transposase
MEIVLARCCGLDVHKKSVTACVLTPGDQAGTRREIRTFETMTDSLVRLADWLTESEVRHVAMESTGIYWKPIWNILEARGFVLLLANARHVQNVPGRKTDVKDAEWLAGLLQHGLMRGSCVPPRDQRETRELTRYRTSIVADRASEVNRVHKVLESANIKIASVASEVLGVSARRMVEALIAGSTDPATMAELARGRLRDKIPLLERALDGQIGQHQRFLLAQILAHIDFLDAQIVELDARIAERTRPFDHAIEQLDTIPGISRRGAEIIIAEIGTDLARFPSAHHLASWAGMCPGNNESAGKRRTGRTRQGNPALRVMLTQAAHAASRTKNTYLNAQFHRIAARRGPRRAAVAVGHSILTAVYHILTRDVPYHDLGHTYFDTRNRERAISRYVHQLRRLGVEVTLTPTAA